MNKLLELNIQLEIDRYGKLRTTTQENISKTHIVVGFKIKAFKETNYVFPILKIEILKR